MTDQVLFTFIGAVIGYAVNFIFSKKLEFGKQVSLVKVEVYSDYFKAVAMASKLKRTSENLYFLTHAKTKICLYGSKAVVEKLHCLEKEGNTAESKGGRDALVALLSEMRKDARMGIGDVNDDVLCDILFGIGYLK